MVSLLALTMDLSTFVTSIICNYCYSEEEEQLQGKVCGVLAKVGETTRVEELEANINNNAQAEVNRHRQSSRQEGCCKQKQTEALNSRLRLCIRQFCGLYQCNLEFQAMLAN